MTQRTVRPARALRGTIAVPGDKSISHRAAILNALADGDAVVQNFLLGDDCLSTLSVLRALGVAYTLDDDAGVSTLRVRGRGLDGLREPVDVLDCGNSGTTMRLMAGVLAGQRFHSVLTGDASLRGRPMARIVEPLRKMGAIIDARQEGRLAPLSIRGGGLLGIDYRLPVASAQTKSAILIAGLFAEGDTTVEETGPTRDHTERMLDAMGARIEREGPAVRLSPGGGLEPLSLRVPNDISAAAFWMVAAAAHPDAELHLTGVGLNPTRAGIIDALREMGAEISVEEERVTGGEPAADIVVRSSELHGITVDGDLAVRMMDEMPAFAVAAALARGRTEIRDAQELRVKESDRIATVASQLSLLGANVSEREDGLVIEGGKIAGGEATSHGDHRLAMALAIAGLVSGEGVTVHDADAVSVSYPTFWTDLERVAG